MTPVCSINQHLHICQPVEERSFISLPTESILQIFQYLGSIDLLSVGSSSWHFYWIVDDDILWNFIFTRDFAYCPKMDISFKEQYKKEFIIGKNWKDWKHCTSTIQEISASPSELKLSHKWIYVCTDKNSLQVFERSNLKCISTINNVCQNSCIGMQFNEDSVSLQDGFLSRAGSNVEGYVVWNVKLKKRIFQNYPRSSLYSLLTDKHLIIKDGIIRSYLLDSSESFEFKNSYNIIGHPYIYENFILAANKSKIIFWNKFNGSIVEEISYPNITELVVKRDKVAIKRNEKLTIYSLQTRKLIIKFKDVFMFEMDDHGLIIAHSKGAPYTIYNFLNFDNFSIPKGTISLPRWINRYVFIFINNKNYSVWNRLNGTFIKEIKNANSLTLDDRSIIYYKKGKIKFLNFDTLISSPSGNVA